VKEKPLAVVAAVIISSQVMCYFYLYISILHLQILFKLFIKNLILIGELGGPRLLKGRRFNRY